MMHNSDDCTPLFIILTPMPDYIRHDTYLLRLRHKPLGKAVSILWRSVLFMEWHRFHENLRLSANAVCNGSLMKSRILSENFQTI